MSNNYADLLEQEYNFELSGGSGGFTIIAKYLIQPVVQIYLPSSNTYKLFPYKLGDKKSLEDAAQEAWNIAEPNPEKPGKKIGPRRGLQSSVYLRSAKLGGTEKVEVWNEFINEYLSSKPEKLYERLTNDQKIKLGNVKLDYDTVIDGLRAVIDSGKMLPVNEPQWCKLQKVTSGEAVLKDRYDTWTDKDGREQKRHEQIYVLIDVYNSELEANQAANEFQAGLDNQTKPSSSNEPVEIHTNGAAKLSKKALDTYGDYSSFAKYSDDLIKAYENAHDRGQDMTGKPLPPPIAKGIKDNKEGALSYLADEWGCEPSDITALMESVAPF